MNTQRPPAPQGPLQVPQNYLQPQTPVVLQNLIPHQGVINTQQEVIPTPQQMGKYPNPGQTQPGNPVDHKYPPHHRRGNPPTNTQPPIRHAS
jgi:hypothetical protein